MEVHLFPLSWLTRLNLKVFAVNRRTLNSPNFWCLCHQSNNLDVVDIRDQQISFSFMVNGIMLGITAVYASTCYLARRMLWSNLQEVLVQHNIPWSIIGEFNTILGAHEYCGSFSPARGPMEEFSLWTDRSHLVHIPTSGARYTWSNGRSEVEHTQKRLDRVICNQNLIDVCSITSCSTLVRNRSDHYPLLFHFYCLSSKVRSNFRFLQAWTLHPECKRVVESAWKTYVVGCPMYVLAKKLQNLKKNLKD